MQEQKEVNGNISGIFKKYIQENQYWDKGALLL